MGTTLALRGCRLCQAANQWRRCRAGEEELAQISGAAPPLEAVGCLGLQRGTMRLASPANL